MAIKYLAFKQISANQFFTRLLTNDGDFDSAYVETERLQMASDKSLAESDVERVLGDSDPRAGTLLADVTPTTVTPNTDEFSAAERNLIRQRLGM
jgi:hypothetical protein